MADQTTLTRNATVKGENVESARSVDVGKQIHELMAKLYPICRSITGNGVRASLRMLQAHIPLDIREVPSGTPAFDWTIPKEWNIKAAYLKDPKGKTIVDFEQSNLHVLNYSVPVHRTLTLSELKPHLHSLPENPDWIPYRTSYYKEEWGFCLRHNQLLQLPEGNYEVLIDSRLEDGHLSYGEYFLKGETDSEILISTHICHPSLANDNLSGVALATLLAKHLSDRPSRYSYRFLFIPGTIGSIAWLSVNERVLSKIKHGLVLACVGDSGQMSYKKSRRGNADIDRAVTKVLKDANEPYQTFDFSPYGYDERQYCSPGFNLPMGCLMRTPHGQFPEYHTSADNLDFVQPKYLADYFAKCFSILQLLEQDVVYRNLNPKCEPQLGRRGLYSTLGGQAQGKARELAMLWVLNLSDGRNSLLDISEQSGLAFSLIQNAAHDLRTHDLLQEVQAAES